MAETTQHMPLWVQAAADQRAARIVESINVEDAIANDVIITSYLKEAPPWLSLEDWDHACDNCLLVRPEGFSVRTIKRSVTTKHGALRVILTVGACARCWGAP